METDLVNHVLVVGDNVVRRESSSLVFQITMTYDVYYKGIIVV